jgi:hypothetical protein
LTFNAGFGRCESPEWIDRLPIALIETLNQSDIQFNDLPTVQSGEYVSCRRIPQSYGSYAPSADIGMPPDTHRSECQVRNSTNGEIWAETHRPLATHSRQPIAVVLGRYVQIVDAGSKAAN